MSAAGAWAPTGVCLRSPHPTPLPAGPAAWQAVTRAWAAKVEEQGEPHLAALHLLAVGDVEAAVQVRGGQRASWGFADASQGGARVECCPDFTIF